MENFIVTLITCMKVKIPLTCYGEDGYVPHVNILVA
jgi:hypothetical protein